MSEEHARSVFGVHEGTRINEELRLIKLDADDARWSTLAQVYRDRGGKGFHGWHIERRYSAAEIKTRSFISFKSGRAFFPQVRSAEPFTTTLKCVPFAVVGVFKCLLFGYA
jgi:hypothetical protein